MARFSYEEADNYGGSGGQGFFSLSNDGDVARVRFMYKGLADIEGYAVHQIEYNGKKRYVNCLREYGHPVDDCPLCKKGMFVNAKLFIPVYDVESGQIKIWERGKKFFSKLSGLCARYASDTDFVSHQFDVERHGKKGDTQTTYEIFEVKNDGTKLEDLPEVPDVLGGIVLDKSFEELQYFADYNEFPDSTDGSERRSSRQTEEMPVRRRTPSSREDVY